MRECPCSGGGSGWILLHVVLLRLADSIAAFNMTSETLGETSEDSRDNGLTSSDDETAGCSDLLVRLGSSGPVSAVRSDTVSKSDAEV